nr:hypothetical protein [Candidatus Freyarchaeota archaeon]
MSGGGKKELEESGMGEFETVNIEDIKDSLVVAGGIRVVGKKSGDVIFSLKLKSDEEDEYSPYWIFCAKWDKMTEEEKERISRVLEQLIETCWIMDVPIFDCDQMISEAFKAGMRPDGEYVTFYALDHASLRMIPRKMRMISEKDFENLR